jgi:DNA-binding response OmpR family regulator
MGSSSDQCGANSDAFEFHHSRFWVNYRIELGEITLDVDGRDAFRAGTALNLTTREFELLHLLARHRNMALASAWIFENVWGEAAELGSKALAVYVSRLRGKIESDAQRPRLLLSIRGFGYKLVVESE